MEYNDDLLIYYIHLNNKSAYDILFDKYHKLTIAIFANKVNFKVFEQSDFDDLIQDCLPFIIKAIYTYRNEEGSFYNYYTSIIINLFNTYIKFYNEKKNKMVFEHASDKNETSLFNYLSDSYDIRNDFNCREKRKLIYDSVSTNIAKEVIYLKQEGYSYKEIQDLLNVTHKQIEYILTLSKRKMRKIYD